MQSIKNLDDINKVIAIVQKHAAELCKEIYEISTKSKQMGNSIHEFQDALENFIFTELHAFSIIEEDAKEILIWNDAPSSNNLESGE